MTRKALGRGLRALIPEMPAPAEGSEEAKNDGPLGHEPNGDRGRVASPEERTAPPPAGSREILHYLTPEEIVPNPRQPRTDWPPESLEELARSIKTRGLLEPIIVRPSGSKYEIIAGERRWRACRIAGLGEIPSLVRTMSDHESLETALVENIQRSDLNPIDEARAYKVLATEYDLTHDDIAKRVGKDRSTVTNALRLLKLNDTILVYVSRGTLSVGHARVLLNVPEDQQDAIARRMAEEGWSVRQAEAWARRGVKGRAARSRSGSRGQRKPAYLIQIEEQLCEHLGSEVRIRAGRRGGRMEIRYQDDEDLSRLLELLGVVVV